MIRRPPRSTPLSLHDALPISKSEEQVAPLTPSRRGRRRKDSNSSTTSADPGLGTENTRRSTNRRPGKSTQKPADEPADVEPKKDGDLARIPEDEVPVQLISRRASVADDIGDTVSRRTRQTSAASETTSEPSSSPVRGRTRQSSEPPSTARRRGRPRKVSVTDSTAEASNLTQQKTEPLTPTRRSQRIKTKDHGTRITTHHTE